MVSLNMNSLKKRSQGFTIVELLIVIVVIGILAALVVTTYAGIQGKARNSERQTDIQSIATQVEAYYTQNNSYPAVAQINDTTWRGTNMRSLDPGALADPSSKAADTAAKQQLGTAATPPVGTYSYVATPANCTTAAADCTGYTLTATYEGTVNGDTKYEKKNLN